MGGAERDDALVAEGYRLAEAITRDRAKSFAFASIALNGNARRAAYAVYAFCRRCDDAVDGDAGVWQGLPLPERVARLRDEIETAYSGRNASDPLLAAFSDTVLAHGVPRAAFEDLATGMEQDLTISRYETWEDLLRYCELAAGTVGRMMASILGVCDSSALVNAAALGRAMQLTNILRDVREDLEVHGRIYLPLEALASRGLEESHLVAFARDGELGPGRKSDAFRDLMREGAARAQVLYRVADRGVPQLTTRAGRSCVRLMRAAYSDILSALAHQHWDPFATRAKTSTGRKVRVGARAVLLPGLS